MSEAKRAWKGTTGGGNFGQNFLFWLLRHVKVTAVYPILYLVIPFYLLFGRKGYRAIYSLFRKRLGQSKWRAFCSTFRNHLLFGQVVLDKFAMLAGNTQQFDIQIDGLPYFNHLLNQPRGFILAGSHFGNFELAGQQLKQEQKKICGIVYGGESAALQQRRANAFQRTNLSMIFVSDTFSHLFAVKQALDEGNIVAIPCDRILGSPKKITHPFLGCPADFPIGTFRLAAQLNAPMLAIFVVKETKTRYHGYVVPITAHSDTAPAKRAETLAIQYVEALEKMVRKYPEQWFNYFDFWSEEVSTNS